MLLPAILLAPSASTSFVANTNVYTSDGNGFIYNALQGDIPALALQGCTLVAPRNNVSANRDPLPTDDFGALYFPGSIWVNIGPTSPRVWICTAMGATHGNATWAQVLSGSPFAGDVTNATAIPTGSTTARTIGNLFADNYNNVKTFGAAGNGSTDDTGAINAAITEAGVNGQPVYFPSGTYKVTSAINVDLNALGSTSAGIWLVGDGMNRSIIDGSVAGGFTPLQIFGGGGTPGAQTNCFFGGMRDIGVKANWAGYALLLGTNNFADALNAFGFYDINVKNTSTSSASMGVKINYVLNTVFSNLVCNTGGLGTGIALELNQSAFNVFNGGSFSSSQTGVHITNGFNFSNIFNAPDIEVVNHCVVNDSANGNAHNVFIGGQFVWNGASNYAIVSSVGNGNGRIVFDNVNFAPSSGSGDLFVGTVLDPSNSFSVIIRGDYGNGTTPANGQPASGTLYQNLTGQAMQIIVYPGSGTTGMSVVVTPGGGSPFTISDSTNGPVSVILRPRYSITVNWSTTQVGWVWIPVPT